MNYSVSAMTVLTIAWTTSIFFSDDMDSHITDLRRVLEKLRATGFTQNGSKYLLGQSSIAHLGFQYSAQDVSLSIDKTKAIAEWPTPTTLKELRSFLGLANFCRNFVPFANISAPLNDLTSN